MILISYIKYIDFNNQKHIDKYKVTIFEEIHLSHHLDHTRNIRLLHPQ